MSDFPSSGDILVNSMHDLELLRQWVELNRDVSAKHWNGESYSQDVFETQNFSPYGSDTSGDENGASIREEIMEVAASSIGRPQSGFSSACDPGRDALLLRSRE